MSLRHLNLERHHAIGGIKACCSAMGAAFHVLLAGLRLSPQKLVVLEAVLKLQGCHSFLSDLYSGFRICLCPGSFTRVHELLHSIVRHGCAD